MLGTWSTLWLRLPKSFHYIAINEVLVYPNQNTKIPDPALIAAHFTSCLASLSG